MKPTREFKWVSALDPKQAGILLELQEQMMRYYASSPTYYQDVSFAEINWLGADQPLFQDALKETAACRSMLEVGCGTASILNADPSLESKYTGLDFSSELLKTNAANHPRASFRALENPCVLPYADSSFDLVLSVFVIEHIVFPNVFLNECLRVLKKGGTLLIICPDFLGRGTMSSQRVGLSQGTGRSKIRAGKWLDACLTGLDCKVRMPLICLMHRILCRTSPRFMINCSPCCFEDSFIVDVDAVYVTYEPEIRRHTGAAVKWEEISKICKAFCRLKQLIYMKGRRR